MNRTLVRVIVALVLLVTPSAQAVAAAADEATAVTATAGTESGAVNVSWTAPTNTTNLLGYRILPYTGGVAVNSLAYSTSGLGTGPVTITGLTNGTPYTFSVQARYASAWGTESVKSSAATPFTVPDAPTISSVTAGNGQVDVAWSAPASDGGSSITQYIISCSPACTQVTVTTLSGSVTGLTNGTEYTFTVQAENARGKSASSAASNAVTPAGAPSAPDSVTATAGDGAVLVSWVAPAAGGSAITGYVVSAYYASDTSSARGTASAGASATSLNVGTLSNGETITNDTSYVFTVYATNASGNGVASAFSNADTPTAGALSPASVTKPDDATVASGSTASFSVNATSDTGTLTYQWEKAALSGGTFSAVTGANSSTYSFTTDNSSGGLYRVKVTNTSGESTAISYSDAATLTVNYVTISTQPVSKTVGVGSTVSVTLAVSKPDAATVSYSWTGSAGDTSTSSSIAPTTSVAATRTYTVVVTSTLTGTTATETSSAATITILPLPSITGQPETTTVGSGGTLELNVVAARGAGSSGTLTYQWYRNGVAISGATAASYSKAGAGATDTGNYNVVVTDSSLSTASGHLNSTSSRTVPVTIGAAAATPSISASPSDASLTAGATLTLSVTASTSDSGMLSYQWYKDGSAISGATAAIYTKTSDVGDSGSYYVIVTNTLNGSTATRQSSAATVTVAAASSGNTGGTSGGGGAATTTLKSQSITFNLAATGAVSDKITLSATASSGLAVSLASESAEICSLTGTTLTLNKVGTCSVTARQAGNSEYGAAMSVTKQLVVGRKKQTLSFSLPSNVTTALKKVTIGANSSAGLPIVIIGGTAGICSVVGNEVEILGPGNCLLQATQAGDLTWDIAQASATLLIGESLSPTAPGSTTKSGDGVVIDTTPTSVPAGSKKVTAPVGAKVTITATFAKPLVVIVPKFAANAKATVKLTTPKSKTISLPSVKTNAKGTLQLGAFVPNVKGTYVLKVTVKGTTKTVTIKVK